MVNFIIYDDDYTRKELYTKVIRKFLYSSNDKYNIYEFSVDNCDTRENVSHIEGVRIYLINLDMELSDGINIARRIRENGDFISPVLLITSRDKKNVIENLRNILFLDLLSYDENIVKNLLLSFGDAYKIVTRHSVYTFSAFDEVYRLPYNDIYYIVKNLKDDSVTIHTKDDSYLHYTSVKSVEKILGDDPRFFKTHRSCIINLYNVSFYDRKDNVVVFNNGSTTNLVARHSKSKLAEKLKEFSNE